MYRQKYQAPELESVTDWIHTSPVSLEKLRGCVVSLVFWRIDCEDSKKVLEKLYELHQIYASIGFVVIGIHEHKQNDRENERAVKSFLMKNHLTLPVGLDNDQTLWNRYNASYYPSVYLVDKRGIVRDQHIGEGGYHSLEQEIMFLLNE